MTTSSTSSTSSTSQPTSQGTGTAGTAMPIQVSYPDTSDLHLRVAEGACRLKVAPAAPEATGAWISGTEHDPSGLRPLHIRKEGGTVWLTEQPIAPHVWDWFRAGHSFADVPVVELALGMAKPFRLTVEIGASENQLDLGGVPISRLALRHGAGKTTVNFSAPNPQPMTLMEIGAGAGSTELRNLANARCAELLIEGGMAAFALDFGGALRQDTHARVTAALSSVDIVVPATTSAKISIESSLGHVDPGEGFTAKEGAFWTQAALEGRTPLLTISASVTLGSLSLRTS